MTLEVNTYQFTFSPRNTVGVDTSRLIISTLHFQMAAGVALDGIVRG
jgi:hypothetical protein